ncbi:MBL fold metallo-hydrolase [Segetibacter sp. 3557_3]|uniref:MBL fold metallo-hydrolase n=1 Tax=Segetibacter sp. 3557_3 TaxID=2547429 RepID=UPI001058C6BD|nr:MBL fold metallo-hydrolase [Segetibacter sp. 3557_3]TDH23489.1 MBL fold metallo-hydrolase [Segetibacter sp. 3557_3]
MNDNIHLDVYNAIQASVNAYIFSDSESIILVDCLRNSHEAQALAERIRTQDKPLTHILITHGHPDHYLGLNVLLHEFPAARIVVLKQEIKDDIINFSTWMESVGWLENEPAMKPKTAANETGFDYARHIDVLMGTSLVLAEGGILELNSDYPPSECEHLTTIYSKDLNAFFPGDFCYNGVHMWLAVDKANIAYWKKQLSQFEQELATQNPTIYPGHGKPADISLFNEVAKYIEDFEETIASSGTRDEAMARMTTLYPNHQQADFLLFNSVNAVIPA